MSLMPQRRYAGHQRNRMDDYYESIGANGADAMVWNNPGGLTDTEGETYLRGQCGDTDPVRVNMLPALAM